jgi:large subunit ribosomal protein L29
MKNMSLFQKLQQMSVEDLRNQLEGTRRDLFGLRLNTATSQVKDFSQYKKLRKHIARVMTAMRAKDESSSSIAKKL